MNIYQVIFEKRDDNLKRLKLYPDWPCVARESSKLEIRHFLHEKETKKQEKERVAALL